MIEDYACIVFAGGIGTRVGNWVQEVYGPIHKCLVPVGKDKIPIIFYVLRAAINDGLRDFYIFYRDSTIEDYFREKGNFWRDLGYKDGIDIQLVEEKPEDYNAERLGRGGTIKWGLERCRIPKSSLVLLNGVDVLPYGSIREMIEVGEKNPENVVLTGAKICPFPIPEKSPPSVIHYDTRDNRVQKMARESGYSCQEGAALHVGPITIPANLLDMFLDVKVPSDPEENIIPELIKKERVRISRPIEAWLPGKTKEQFEAMQDVDIDEFQKTGKLPDSVTNQN